MDAGERSALAGTVAPAGAAEAPEVTALVERAKAGDADAFADLMRLYERRVIAIGIQMGLGRDDALDACQEAFIKVFRYIHRFRSGQSFFKWLYRIAIHAVYDHLKARRRQGTVSLDTLDPAELARLRDGAASPERAAEAAGVTAKVNRALDCLSRQERIVFVLRDLQQMTSEEIGRVLRLSPITVRRHCMTARQKLRARIFPHRA